MEASVSVTSSCEFTEVTSIQHRNDIEKTTWRIHRYFIDFESRIKIELSTSSRRNPFDAESPFIINEISMDLRCGISMSNRWRIDEDVSIIVLFF